MVLRQLFAIRPSHYDVVFAIKTFAGAMLALYLAFYWDLERPSWAMASAFIVANPLSSALSSKVVYRTVGTFLGAATAVLLVPNFAESPEILSFLLAAWVGLCLYMAQLDRTPRSYGFMLAGYTAAIVGFGAVSNPLLVFDTALARVEEITLGVLCATLVGCLVFPRHVGPLVTSRVEAWLHDAGHLIRDTLQASGDTPGGHRRDEKQLATDVAELQNFAVYLAYEPTALYGTTRSLLVLRDHMAELLPLVYAVDQRLQALRRMNGVSASLDALLRDIVQWMDDPQDAGYVQLVERLHDRALPEANWAGLLEINLIQCLKDMLRGMQRCRGLWRLVQRGDSVRSRSLKQRSKTVLHRDHGLAARSGLGAGMAILACCLIWIMTAWPHGENAAMMAAVGCCIYASMDDPVQGIVDFARYNALAAVVACIYQFAVLPAIEGFPMLVAVFAPYFILLGIVMTVPSLYGFAMAMMAGTSVLMNLETVFTVDFEMSVNSMMASIFGLMTAALVTRFVRSIGSDHALRRLSVAGWRDLGGLIHAKSRESRTSFITRMTDRLVLRLPRLAMVPEAVRQKIGSFRAAAVGMDMITLRDLLRHRDWDEYPLARRSLVAVADFFTHRVPGDSQAPSKIAALQAHLDEALVAVLAKEDPKWSELAGALAGLRFDLDPQADPPLCLSTGEGNDR